MGGGVGTRVVDEVGRGRVRVGRSQVSKVMGITCEFGCVEKVEGGVDWVT